LAKYNMVARLRWAGAHKKTALEVLHYWSNEAYWQTRSITRPLCDSRATCL